jgi:predicted RNase H-like nuclease (RuvC/YqgF family)
MTQPIDPIEALRETAELLLMTQQEMGRDVADMAMAVTELTKTSEQMANALGTLDELKRAVEQLGDVMGEYRKLAELFDAQREQQAQIGRYIADQSKQQSGIRQVDKTLQAHLEEHERLKLEPAIGQR